jgi:MFS family permease
MDGTLLVSHVSEFMNCGLTLLSWAYFLGTFIGPIISGNIAAHISWRWFFWVCTIFQGVCGLS